MVQEVVTAWPSVMLLVDRIPGDCCILFRNHDMLCLDAGTLSKLGLLDISHLRRAVGLYHAEQSIEGNRQLDLAQEAVSRLTTAYETASRRFT